VGLGDGILMAGCEQSSEADWTAGIVYRRKEQRNGAAMSRRQGPVQRSNLGHS